MSTTECDRLQQSLRETVKHQTHLFLRVGCSITSILYLSEVLLLNTAPTEILYIIRFEQRNLLSTKSHTRLTIMVGVKKITCFKDYQLDNQNLLNYSGILRICKC